MMDPITLAVSLAQFAPGLMRFFGAGDAPAAVAQKAVDIAMAVTKAGDGQAALTALAADPTLAQAYNLAVLSADTELVKGYLADVQDARARDLELHKTGYANRRADYMVAGDVIGLIACIAILVLFRSQIPGEVVGLLSSIAGIFGCCLRDAHQFEFGSSRSSREKDIILGKAQ